ncbi:MAG: VCBS repeat-containing protein [Nitrospirae bacterium]|nr:VCBS repeat-containing protein [Nitrospirota bacterium]
MQEAQIFDFNTDTGSATAINSFGGSGSTTGMLNAPHGVAVDNVGNIYVADTDNHRIQKFDSSGNFISYWNNSGVGTSSKALGVLSLNALNQANDFFSPDGITIDSSGKTPFVYVTDLYSNQIIKYDTGGKVVTRWGGSGNEDGMFSQPSSIAVDNQGYVYVTDAQNNTIQKFTGKGEFISSQFISSGNESGTADAKFDRPSGLAIDASGNLFVAEASASRIQKFTKALGDTKPAAMKALQTGDFNGDGKSDILWQNSTTGDIVVWLMDGTSISAGGYLSKGVPSSWQIVGIGDLDGDGRSDIVWQNTTTGDVFAWLMNGTTIATGAYLVKGVPSQWQVLTIGDLNGDGKSDIVWQNTTTGDVFAWLMNGTSIVTGNYLAKAIPNFWQAVGMGDLDGDGKSDIVWQNTTTGDVFAWLMDGITIATGNYIAKGMSKDWRIAGIGDLNGDTKINGPAKSDIVLQNSTTGGIAVWFMNGTTITKGIGLAADIPKEWQVVGMGDFNSNSKSDVLLRNTTNGMVYIWLMDGAKISSAGSPGTAGLEWQIK